MIRKSAPTTKRTQVSTTPYPLWLPADQYEVVREAHATSGKLWAEWITLAIDHFKKEPAEEIESLLKTWVRGRKDKKRMNVRITETCMVDIVKLCESCENASIQACLQHALFIHALRTSFSK